MGVASLGYFRPSAVRPRWWDPRFRSAGTRWTVRRRCPLGKPWGTVGYLITRAWAGQLLARYDRRPATALTEHRLAWDFLFFDPKRVAVIPPLIVEDYRCQSLMARRDPRAPERDPVLPYHEYLIT